MKLYRKRSCPTRLLRRRPAPWSSGTPGTTASCACRRRGGALALGASHVMVQLVQVTSRPGTATNGRRPPWVGPAALRCLGHTQAARSYGTRRAAAWHDDVFSWREKLRPRPSSSPGISTSAQPSAETAMALLGANPGSQRKLAPPEASGCHGQGVKSKNRGCQERK